MKNVKGDQLKKCIVMSAGEYKTIIKRLFGEDIHILFKYERTGIKVLKYRPYTSISFEDVSRRLSEYFGVDVTSVHIDAKCDGDIWICYK